MLREFLRTFNVKAYNDRVRRFAMTLVRFAVSALFLCSLPCFSQTFVEPERSLQHAAASPFKTGNFSGFKLSEPWRVAPNEGITLLSGTESNEGNSVENDKSETNFRHSGETRDCFAIRSYLMARENKNSDATYVKASSTCQPASQYQLKSATERAVSRDR